MAKRTSASRLARYQSMRDFDKTPEPAGDTPAPPPKGSSRYVVQRHRARARHYDFRLEMDGVLVSWAVPKGPTLDPDVKRLAVHVEDHPIEYFDFEGVIPSGEYGGGDVIVWDWGTWKQAADKDGDPVQAVADGSLHVDLDGERLHGRFALVRRGSRNGKEQWLMLHSHDDTAVAGWDAEQFPASVKSGRTNEEVKADPDARWDSDAPAAEASVPIEKARSSKGSTPSWPGPSDDDLEALDQLGKGGEWTLAGDTVMLTNLDKELFPGRDGGEPITKRALVRYHARIAPHLLPYLEGRAVNLNRYPDGVERKGFWSKAVPKNAPEWLNRWHYDDHGRGETEWYSVVDRPAALAFLANQAALEIHPWTSRIDRPHEPTWAYIDIDPGPKSTFDDVLTLARLYRTALDHLEVQAGPKVTGKRGIQIWVPIERGPSFDDTRDWVEAISRAVGQTMPELVSWSWHKADREGRARLDFTQNAINKTLVAPFSARPAPGAPVSVPIEWDELDDPELRPDRWTVSTVLDRLADVGDPLRPLIGLPQRLPKVR